MLPLMVPQFITEGLHVRADFLMNTASRIVHSTSSPLVCDAHAHTYALPAGNARGGQHSSHLCLIYPLNHNHHGEADSLRRNKWAKPVKHLEKLNNERGRHLFFNQLFCSRGNFNILVQYSFLSVVWSSIIKYFNQHWLVQNFWDQLDSFQI